MPETGHIDSYFQFIQDSAIYHKFDEDNHGQWPATVFNSVKGLQDALKLPAWVKLVRTAHKFDVQNSQSDPTYVDQGSIPACRSRYPSIAQRVSYIEIRVFELKPGA